MRSHLRQMGVKLPTRKLDSLQSWNALVDLSEEVSPLKSQVIHHYLTLLEHFLEAKAQWEQTIEKIAERLPLVREIEREIPGVGSTLAAVLAAEIGPVQRFHSAKALAGCAGLTPSNRTSVNGFRKAREAGFPEVS